jgi:hypothetical protein
VTIEASPWSWDPDRLALVLETAAGFFESHLADRHREHLRTRYGLTDETIARGRIGFAPVDRSTLIDRFNTAGLTREEIRASGLAWVDDNGARALWSGRIVFPYLVGGPPRFFIARQTDETAERPGPAGTIGKYKKQSRAIALSPTVRISNGIEEPIFGADTVRPGAPLIITEGITDCTIAHQAGYPAVSPVTVRFKREHAAALVALCRPAGRLYLIMDSEASGAGIRGAVDTGIALRSAGLVPYLCEIPRPEELEKVDLNDYIRGGGDPAALFETAIDVSEHPIAAELEREERRRMADRLRSATIRNRAALSTRRKKGPAGPWIDKAEVFDAMPSMAAFAGFKGDGYGEHPHHSKSTTGTNLHITRDQWYFHRAGWQSGGSKFEWFAIYEMDPPVIKEGERIPNDRFREVLEAAADQYVPGWRDRPAKDPA